MTIYGYRIPMWVALVLWFVVWEIVGQTDSVMLIPPFTTILGSFVEVVTTRSFKEAVSVSLQAFGMGMALSLTVGLTVGFLMARYKAAGDIGGMWINIMESSPISAVVPLLLAIIGFGMQTMVVTVFLFSVWVIALDTQVGVQHANKSLIEMARSFGASRVDLYRKVVFWAALPEILAGIRLAPNDRAISISDLLACWTPTCVSSAITQTENRKTVTTIVCIPKPIMARRSGTTAEIGELSMMLIHIPPMSPAAL